MFFKKIVIFFSLFLFLFLSTKVIELYVFENIYFHERAIWKAKVNMVNDYSTYNAPNIILGTSRSLALSPDFIDAPERKFINLSVEAGQIIEMYYLVKRLIDRGERIDSIYIDIPPLNHHELKFSSGFGERFLRYFAHDHEVKEIEEHVKGSYAKFLSTKLIYRDYVNLDFFSLIKKAYETKKYGLSDRGMIEKLEKNRGFFLFGNLTEFDFKKQTQKSNYRAILLFNKTVKKLTNNDIHQAYIYYLKKLIKLLQDNQINYKVFFSPFPKGRDLDDNFFYGKYLQVFDFIPKDKVLNKVLMLEHEYFVDVAHVNYQGALKYNSFFLKCLLNKQCDEFAYKEFKYIEKK